jgi:hypothetical protein
MNKAKHQNPAEIDIEIQSTKEEQHHEQRKRTAQEA